IAVPAAAQPLDRRATIARAKRHNTRGLLIRKVIIASRSNRSSGICPRRYLLFPQDVPFA
ncbi:MAG: hypothetical protein WC712_11390, partial [Candidatus Brocadiia bacterium]